jgi:hypothetical protein
LCAPDGVRLALVNAPRADEEMAHARNGTECL